MINKYVGETQLDTIIENLTNQITQIQNTMISAEKIYPVGSIYISTVNTALNTLFGFGTWEQIKDKFLLAGGSTYTPGSTGGASTHTHTSAAHTHTVSGHTHTSAAHTHTVNGHTHTTASHTLTVSEMPAHLHTTVYDSDGATDLNWGFSYANDGGKRSQYTEASSGVGTTGGGQAHSHGNTGSTSLTTNSTTPGNTGSGSNLPPYLSVYVWKRIS